MKTIFVLVLLFIVAPSYGQVDPKLEIPYVDPTDLPMSLFKKKYAADSSKQKGIPEKGKLIMFIVPAVGSNPTLGAFFGVGGTAAIYLGEPANTSISSLNGSILFTTKSQFIANVKGTIMTPGNNWEMLLDAKYCIFSENTYGLGSDYNQPINESWNIGGIHTSGVEEEQPLTYNQVKVYYTALKKIVKNFYIGIGLHLDYHYNIEDIDLDTAAAEPIITSHYSYNKFHGFSTKEYATSGTSINFLYESRDNAVNPYKGAFVHFSFRNNPTWLGSSQNSNMLYFEGRYFLPLSITTHRHILGFWGIAQMVTSGQVPYLHMPFNANDMRNRSSRGYVAGRFRGPQVISLESEYRFPVSKNGLFGGVVFGGGSTASREALEFGTESVPKLNLFEAIRLYGGIGARLMLNREGRLNLCADMAFGERGAKGFYLTVGETF